MDPLTLIIITIAISSASAILLFSIIKTSKPSNLPPGPHPYPIIGNILELFSNNNPLHTFTHLSKIYGPIITLKLGYRTTIVISSPEIAKQALQKNDAILSSRVIPYTISSTLENHCNNSVIWLPSSSKWRTLRRACATKIFSPQQLNSTHLHRRRKVRDLLDYVHECCDRGEGLNFGEAVFKTVINSVSNTFISKDLVQFNGSVDDFKEILVGFTEESGRPNVADFFPFLRFFDPQGAHAKAKVRDWYTKLSAIFDGAIEERMHQSGSRNDSGECKDALDSLLNFIKEEGSELNRDNILYLFLDLFVAGVDTTSSTLEWVMAELLHSPKNMDKVREELQQVYGRNEQIIDDSQTSKLPYLNAVVKETLRLHPPAPFLVPHKSNEDVELGGFMVPKNSQILVNVWSIGRDSSVWTNTDLFEPERFLESDIDFKGKNFELIPFGAGRRICPGLSLASRTIPFMLASLLHHFNWKLANDMKPEDIDMSGDYGITLHKAEPLWVVPIKDSY